MFLRFFISLLLLTSLTSESASLSVKAWSFASHTFGLNFSNTASAGLSTGAALNKAGLFRAPGEDTSIKAKTNNQYQLIDGINEAGANLSFGNNNTAVKVLMPYCSLIRIFTILHGTDTSPPVDIT